MGITFGSNMFPHTILVYPSGYTEDLTGGTVLTDGTPVSMAANVQSEGYSGIRALPADETHAPQGEQYYDVSTQTDPGVIINQTIGWNGLALICLDVASKAFRGQLYRVRCVTRT